MRRLILRTQLWNGNRESLLSALSRDPERSVLRVARTRHAHLQAGYAAQSDDRWVRLTNRAAVRRFLREARAMTERT